MPKPDEKLFHVHADIMRLGNRFRTEVLERYGFSEDHFLSHEQIRKFHEDELEKMGYTLDDLQSGTPPQEHWTVKASQLESEKYTDVREGIRQWIAANRQTMQTTCYIESETVRKWFLPNSGNFNPAIQVPFDLMLKEPVPRKEEELHFSTSAKDTDPRLIKALVASGLYAVMTPKENQNHGIVLTAQGTREQLRELLPQLYQYLLEAGGYSNDAKLMVERIDLWEETEGASMANVIDSL